MPSDTAHRTIRSVVSSGGGDASRAPERRKEAPDDLRDRGTAGTSLLRVDVLSEEGALPALESDWARLLPGTPSWAGFQSFAWVSGCVGLLGHDQRLHVLVVRAGGDVVAILPAALGSAGDLRFVGDPVSNYLGPVYRPERLDDVVRVLAAFLGSKSSGIRLLDLRGIRAGSPFLGALGRSDMPGWSRPHLVETSVCPYVDLSAGWKALYQRRGNDTRRHLLRRWRSLEQLGPLRVAELTEARAVERVLPAVFDLFRARWEGRRESGGFADRFRAFHARAAPALAAAGHVRLSVLELGGTTLAFSYGVATQGGPSSYVMGYDDTFRPYSPGALLLARLLESACARGEPEYDFSLGDEGYKGTWATGARPVFRLLRWRNESGAALAGCRRMLVERAWVQARSIPWLRRLKREGIRRAVLGPPPAYSRPDSPGFPAGQAGTWRVYRVAPPRRTRGNRRPIAVQHWDYETMARELSPSLLALALDRHYRGDTMLALHGGDGLTGLVWRVGNRRRALVTGGHEPPASEPVYYHPIPARESELASLVRALAEIEAGASGLVVVTSGSHLRDCGAAEVATVVADLDFEPPVRRSLLDRLRLGSGDGV